MAQSPETNIKIAVSSQKLCFYSKSSSGHVECSFDKPAKIIHQRSEKLSLKVQNLFENYSSQKACFSSKCSPGHIECIFDNHDKILAPQSTKHLAQSPKERKEIFFSKSMFYTQ